MISGTMRNTLLITLLFFLVPCLVQAEDDTRIVMLGTGTPAPNYLRSGPATAIIHKGQAYVFDAGGGMVRQAIKAWQTMDIQELNPLKICCLFFTHLHSDHIHDYSELATALWWARDFKLRAWGPVGLREMTDGMEKMAKVEVDLRTRGTPRKIILHPDYYKVDVTEIHDGIVFQKDDLTIEAFTVPHGQIKPAFGYKITTADKSIVLSGDTTYSENLAEKARGVDILIHEVASAKKLAEMEDFWQFYHGTSHTPSDKLAKLANKARPKLLVLYHVLFLGATEQEILDEIREAGYDGKVVVANDLDIFTP